MQGGCFTKSYNVSTIHQHDLLTFLLFSSTNSSRSNLSYRGINNVAFFVTRSLRQVQSLFKCVSRSFHYAPKYIDKLNNDNVISSRLSLQSNCQSSSFVYDFNYFLHQFSSFYIYFFAYFFFNILHTLWCWSTAILTQT